MLAKILIKRRFKQGYTHEVIALLHDLRTAAMSQPGYISGETLIHHEDPQRTAVISTWQNIESWRQWKQTTISRHLDDLLNRYLEEPAVYEEYVVGAAVS